MTNVDKIFKNLVEYFPKTDWKKYSIEAECVEIIQWICPLCKKTKAHKIVGWLIIDDADFVNASRTIVDALLDHACITDDTSKNAIDLLVCIIKICVLVWVESIDDSIKRFALLEFD